MRVTVIDNFDSFTFNLVDYFKRLECQVRVYRNDVPIEMVAASEPALLVFSPGPSTPANAGNLMAYIDHFHRTVPLFGVCLGHQAMIESLSLRSSRLLPPGETWSWACAIALSLSKGYSFILNRFSRWRTITVYSSWGICWHQSPRSRGL